MCLRKRFLSVLGLALVLTTSLPASADEPTCRKWMEFLVGQWTGEMGNRTFAWGPGDFTLRYELKNPDGRVIAVGLMARVAANDSIMHTMHNPEGMVARMLYSNVSDTELKGTAVYLMPDGNRVEGEISMRKDDDHTISVTVDVGGNLRQVTVKRRKSE